MLAFDLPLNPLGLTAGASPPSAGEWALLLLVAALLGRLAFVLHRQQAVNPTTEQPSIDDADDGPTAEPEILTLLDGLGLYAVRTNLDGEITQAGQGISRLLDKPTAEVESRSVRDILPLIWIDERGRMVRDGWSRILAPRQNKIPGRAVLPHPTQGSISLHLERLPHPEGWWLVLKDQDSWAEHLKWELHATLRHQSLRLLIQDFGDELEHCLKMQRHRLALPSDTASERSLASTSELLAGLRHAERAVSDLVSFTREDRDPTQEITTADLPTLAKQVLADLAPASDVPMEFRQTGPLPPLDADPERVALVLKCLLTTVHHLTAADDRLTIVASKSPSAASAPSRLPPSDTDGSPAREHLRIEVQGPSKVLSEKAVSELFRPSSDVAGHRLGLGFAAAREILRRQRGSLAVSSNPDEGTRITMVLPSGSIGGAPTPDLSAGAATPAKAPPTAQPKREPRPKSDRDKTRILVMDDEQSILSLLTAALKRLGFDCRTTRHGDEAIDATREAQAQDRPFALAIIDLTIPGGMGGVDAAAALGEVAPTMILIASSGYAQNPALTDFRNFGFHDALVKPYRIPDLAKLLNKHLPPA